jgi:hypothetical protein
MRTAFAFGHGSTCELVCPEYVHAQLPEVLAPPPVRDGVLMTLTIESGAQSRDRAQIPEKFKWNLADIYPTEAAWRAAKDKLAADLNTLGQYRGKVAYVPARWPTRSSGRRCSRRN